MGNRCGGGERRGAAAAAVPPAKRAAPCGGLISCAELDAALRAPSPPLVIAVATEADHRDARIASAVRVWRPDYQKACGPGQPLDGLALERDDFATFARCCGVLPAESGQEVVLYDHKFDATRLWWLFALWGRGVRVLDGGMAKWRAEGRAVRTGDPSADEEREGRGRPAQKPVDDGWAPVGPQLSDHTACAGTADVRRLRGDDGAALWDVREPDEYSGAACKMYAARPGRIPWARGRVDWGVVRRPDGTYRGEAELRDALTEAGVDAEGAHVFYCHSGVRTTQLIFAMHCVLRRPLAELRNYDGSWIEWSHGEENPVELDAGHLALPCPTTA